MPMHDWTRVDVGIYHDFHLGWVCELCSLLNRDGVLPLGYHAMTEYGGRLWWNLARVRKPGGRVRDDREHYVALRRTICIRRNTDRSYAGLVELASPATTLWPPGAARFRDKRRKALGFDIPMLIADPFAATDTDEPNRRPMAVCSESAGVAVVEPVAIGRPLPTLPLVLVSGAVVNVPLERAYQARWAKMIPMFRARLEE